MKLWKGIRWLVIGLLLAGLGGQAGFAAESDGAFDRAEIEAAIDTAREELDAAAARLAQLHRELFERGGQRDSRPMLGLLLGEADGQDGVLIVGVTPGGGAELAGLASGDRLLAIDGHRFDTGGSFSERFNQALGGLEPGAVVNVEYAREGATLQAAVTTQAQQDFRMRILQGDMDWLPDQQELSIEIEAAVAAGQEAASTAMAELRTAWPVIHNVLQPSGLRLEEISGDLARYFQVDGGVLVLSVAGSAAGSATGLRAGDILRSIDGEAIDGVGDAYKRLHRISQTTPAEVIREGAQLSIQIEPSAMGQGPQRIFIHKEIGHKEIVGPDASDAPDGAAPIGPALIGPR